MFFGTSRVAGGFGAVELWEHKSTGETYVPWREPGVDESYCTISRISFEYIYIFIIIYKCIYNIDIYVIIIIGIIIIFVIMLSF